MNMQVITNYAVPAPHSWRASDEAARLAISVAPADVGKYALQMDNMTEWMLVDANPPSWDQRSKPAEATPPAPATPDLSRPGIVCIDEVLNAIYGVGGWTNRTGVGAGTDIGPALIAACATLRAKYGRGEIFIPPGRELLAKTVPSAAQWAGVTLRGAGSQASTVILDSNSANFYSTNAAQGISGGGVHSLCIALEAGHPNSACVAVSLQGGSQYQPDQTTFSDLYITRKSPDSYWYSGFVAYGNDRTSPQGIRGADVRNVQIFGCKNAGVYLSNAVQWDMSNIGVYQGVGGGSNFYIAGGGTPATNSTQIRVDGLVCGELNIANATKFFVSGTAATVNSQPTAYLGDISIPGAAAVGAFGPGVRVFVG
ncbi:hypothetical protein AVMA1855_20020 [Acidovorax sp. SUPP1855]|uniref:hypothetical protein n=1 Tax=Acidovorax sp. SUPP1855 TaxID=431774 RepID=UPI0023DE31D8|nr:hypothetical protein [Acidovorax sp. SUPP1855]GKS86478.1 hypothetical protein AVMA1855_20020 [Acidovorax sp. SUPP1855]